MRKTTLGAFVLVAGMLGVLAVQAVDSIGFTDSFKTCSEYYGSQTVELNNIKMVTTKQVLGMKDNKCNYKETISMQDSVYAINCNFTKKQVSELVKVMKDFDKDTSAQNIDLNDYDAVQNTPVAQAWSKYFNDANVCSVEMK